MALNVFILAAAFLINLILAFLVFFKNKKNLVHQSFAAMVLSIAGWTGSIALALATKQIAWEAVSFAFSSIIPATLLLFVLIFEPSPRWRKRYGAVFIPPLLFSFIAYYKTDLNFDVLRPYFFIYLFGYGLAALTILLQRVEKGTGIYKNQIRYLLFGIFSFVFLALISNFILPWRVINQFNPLVPLLLIIMVGVISYSILKYRLLEIKLVLETFFIYSLSLLVTLLIAIVAQKTLQKTALFSQPLLNVIVLTAALFLFPGLKKFFSIAIESINRPTFNAENSIKDLAENLTHLVDLEEIIRTINDTVTNSMAVKATATAIFSRDKIEIYSNRPYPVDLPQLLNKGPVLRYLSDFKSPLVTQEVFLMADPEKKENFMSKVAGLISRYSIEVYLPLIHQNKLIGVITLDKKISGEAFTKSEIEMLETLSFQAAISISNGRLYKEVKDLNLNLKNKVKEQTKHLDRLLKIKEEFLKITSHQLRTPTTIVKGMLSMILEGSLDHDESKKRQYLEQAYSSAVNLERVIHGILDASDLAAGKLMMDFEPTDLKEIVHQLVAERSHLASEKNVALKFEAPQTAPPSVPADKLKIREALANLIDNAIRYTPKGEVCVSIESSSDNRWITVCVKDNGIGIKPEDRKRIFKKFARTDESMMINPNGSGLGLYVVKEIIDAHRGHIEVESSGENLGSVFKITIPTKSEAT